VAKSATEQIRELITDFTLLSERADNLKREAEKLEQNDAHLLERVVSLEKELALLRQRFEDHLKRVEVLDSRNWNIKTLVFGAVLSLVSGLAGALIITFIRR
jgi:predicted nuclease with TOPRIM domain